MTVVRGHALDFFSYSAAQTRRFGAHLGRLLEPGDVLLLHGSLGAGKTQLAQGVAEALGVTRAVRSPTFTLINEYPEARIPLYHVDLYRLDGVEDLATIGLDELFDGEGVVLVEWPERAADALPDDALRVTLQHAGETRRTIRIEADGERPRELLAGFKDGAFARRHG